jgi:putative hydrolase of the HAD superfamily
MFDATPSWSEIDHVLLDMDGTVLDLAFDNYFWRELVPRRYALAAGLTPEQALSELLSRLSGVEHSLSRYSIDYWSEITGLDLSALEREVRDRVAFRGGSAAFLEAVRASGRSLWLVTNAPPTSCRMKLEQVGLDAVFDVVISSHELGVPKEDAVFWRRLQAQRPFPVERALFADDSLPVLRAARDHGIAHLVAMRQPDSTRPEREIAEFPSAACLGALLPL